MRTDRFRGVTLDLPTWRYEREILNRGFSAIAGVDEVGRGPLAGPVVAAAVILPKRLRGGWTPLIRDSKQLTPAQRETACSHLHKVALAIGVGAASHDEIDSIGIVGATRRAMARAVESLEPVPDHLLIDAVALPGVAIAQTSIIKGDVKSRSVAAASIVAKVTRDRLMREVFERRYPGYGFADHKGYYTDTHVAALERLGPCPIHRRSFEPVRGMVERPDSAADDGAVVTPVITPTIANSTVRS